MEAEGENYLVDNPVVGGGVSVSKAFKCHD